MKFALVFAFLLIGGCSSVVAPPSNDDSVLGPLVEGKLSGSGDKHYIPYSAYTSGSPVIATEAYVDSKFVPTVNLNSGTDKARLWLSKYNGGTGHKDAATKLDGSSQYVQIGGREYGANSYRGIGYGYISQVGDIAPVFIGMQEKNPDGSTSGDAVLATRQGTSGALAVRFRVTGGGDILGEGAYTPANDQSLTTKKYVDGKSLSPAAVTAIKALTSSSTLADVISALTK